MATAALCSALPSVELVRTPSIFNAPEANVTLLLFNLYSPFYPIFPRLRAGEDMIWPALVRLNTRC